MPPPRVFVSSTCYDLKYVRENLKYFIRSLGYEPVLSEEGSVFYAPNLHVQEACLAEVPSCQIFILIIGGRYGGRYRDTEKSITNAEYERGAQAKVPIFALVERDVYDQYRVFLSNRGNPEVDERKIAYPAVDSTRIFDFIEEVQGQSVNNALVPFADFEEIQSYLKQQWASMMYSFLTSESEAKKVGDTIATLSQMSQKVAFLTRQVLETIGDPITKATAELYDLMIGSEVTRDLMGWNLHPTPQKICQHETFQDFVGGGLRVEEDAAFSIVYSGPPYVLSRDQFETDVKAYAKLRTKLLEALEQRGLTLEEYLGGK